MSERYDICFSGQIMEGHEVMPVRDKLATLFKADTVTLDRLFSGRTVVIKRGCDKAIALQYKRAMENAGAKPIFRVSEERHNQASSNVDTDATAPTNTDTTFHDIAAAEGGIMTLAPPLSDVLRDDERPVVAELDIDTSRLQLKEAGSRLSNKSPPTIYTVNTDHLGLAEVGALIPTLSTTQQKPIPNTTDIKLDNSGADMDHVTSPAQEALQMNLSALQMEPPDSDMLEEHPLKTKDGTVPSTDHLSLKD